MFPIVELGKPVIGKKESPSLSLDSPEPWSALNLFEGEKAGWSASEGETSSTCQGLTRLAFCKTSGSSQLTYDIEIIKNGKKPIDKKS